MIKKLRIKLILASMFSLVLVLFVIVGGINVLNIFQMIERADMVLDILENHEGQLPKLAMWVRFPSSAPKSKPGYPYFYGMDISVFLYFLVAF